MYLIDQVPDKRKYDKRESRRNAMRKSRKEQAPSVYTKDGRLRIKVTKKPLAKHKRLPKIKVVSEVISQAAQCYDPEEEAYDEYQLLAILKQYEVYPYETHPYEAYSYKEDDCMSCISYYSYMSYESTCT